MNTNLTQKISHESMVLQQCDGHWQKLAALILWKLNGGKIVRVTAADIEAMNAQFAPGTAVILTHGHSDSIEFSIIDADAAERMAAHDATMKGSA
jgi:hypothetical protein